MRILIAGDQHGETLHAVHVVKEAKRLGIDSVVVAGDCGLWSHEFEGVKHLDALNEASRKLGVVNYWVGGNHENWDHWNWHIDNGPKVNGGFVAIRSNILLAPRVHSWHWGGKKFLSAAGAVSIDKDWRIELLRQHGQVAWWPDEQMTDSEASIAIIKGADVSYLITHDCSNSTQFKFRLKDDIDSYIHRQRIDKILKSVKPKIHFHGHMHEKYDWINYTGPERDNETQTYGLECNGKEWSWGVLDTESDGFKWLGR